MNPLVYEPRAVGFHDAMTVGDHRIKVYSLRSRGHAETPLPSADTIGRVFEAGLPRPELEADHKVGFGILHWADDGHYALVNTWYDANMLRLKVLGCDDLDKAEPILTPLDHLSVIACVWELVIYKYERDLWVREVLGKRPTALGDDVLAPYLADGYVGLA